MQRSSSWCFIITFWAQERVMVSIAQTDAAQRGIQLCKGLQQNLTNAAPCQALLGPTAISDRTSRAPHTTTQHPTFHLHQPLKLSSFTKPEARQGSAGSCM